MDLGLPLMYIWWHHDDIFRFEGKSHFYFLVSFYFFIYLFIYLFFLNIFIYLFFFW